VIENLGQAVSGNPLLAIAAVFLGGLISASSPCVLAIMPMVIGYVGGAAGGDGRRGIGVSLLFALGLAITFTTLGAAASLAGMMFGNVGRFWYWTVGVIAIAMGLSMMGVWEFNIPFTSRLQTHRQGYPGAFLLGLLFGVVSSPCATPVLVIILSIVAAGGQVVYGVLLLFVYALGHCTLIVTAGIATGFVSRMIASEHTERISRIIKQISGGLIVVAGFWIIKIGIR